MKVTQNGLIVSLFLAGRFEAAVQRIANKKKRKKKKKGEQIPAREGSSVSMMLANFCE